MYHIHVKPDIFKSKLGISETKLNIAQIEVERRMVESVKIHLSRTNIGSMHILQASKAGIFMYVRRRERTMYSSNTTYFVVEF